MKIPTAAGMLHARIVKRPDPIVIKAVCAISVEDATGIDSYVN